MQRKGSRRYLEHGVAIITVLLVLSILAVIGMGIATMGQGHVAVTVSQNNSERAYMAAEAAALYACDVLGQIPTPSGGAVEMAPGSTAARALSASSPDLLINATTSGWAPSAGMDYTPPGCTTPIHVPAEHIYVVGCGNLNSNTFQPTVRYVGLMCTKSAPGGVYYYGAYAKNNLIGDGNKAGVTDAYNRSAGPYAPASRVPFADIVGAGNSVNVANQTKLYGNASGPVVGATNTNFNNMGTARRPGISVQLPQPPWPSLAPSPGLDIIISKTNVYMVDQDAYFAATGSYYTPPGPGTVYNNVKQWNDLEINGKAQVHVIATPGSNNYAVNDLCLWGGDLIVNTSLLNPANNDTVGFYVARDGATGDAIEITMGAQVVTVDNVPARADQPKFLNFYYNGVNSVKIVNTSTNVTGTFASSRATTNILMYGEPAGTDGPHLKGSLVSANDVLIANNAHLHYDVGLKSAPFDPDNFQTQQNGNSLGIISHQRL